MALIVILITVLYLLFYYYKPTIDFVIIEKGFKVLLWYNKWDQDSDDTFIRQYIHLFNIRLRK